MRRLTVLAAVVTVAMTTVPAAGQSPPAGGISLVSQSPWVGAGGDFELRLRVDPPPRAERAEVAVSVYPAVESRSEFTLTLDNKTTASSITTLTFPLSSLRPDPDGTVAVQVPVQDDEVSRSSSRVTLDDEDGVHPVQVELREQRGGRSLHRFTTHLIHLPADHPGAKLGLALILPFHHPPARADGTDESEVAPAALGQSVDAARALPVTLAPTPDTLGGLASSSDGAAAEVLEDLRQVAAQRPVLSSSYVPVSLPALFASGLHEDAATHLDRGRSTLREVLGVEPDPRTWLSEDPLNGDALAALTRRGVSRMVISDGQIEPVPNQKLTLARPFVLEAGGSRVAAVAADSGLATHFQSRDNQVLRAHQLLADLAVLYLDEPGSEGRTLVALPRRSWVPDRQFVDALTAGLNGNPLVRPVSLEEAFQGTQGVPRNTTRVRRPVRTSNDLDEVASDLRSSRRQLDSLASVLGRGNPSLAGLERRQLMAESSELRSTQQRQPYVESVQDGIGSTLDDIKMPEGSSITLTARRGEIPVTFQNRTGYPAQVVVKVESDKLDFPGGTTRPLDLTRRNTTERFAVVARTSGAFPLRITLESPDGNLVIGRARLTVRSTAAAGLSLFVALGAATFLAVWWGRHALRGRRSRRLVTE